MVTANVKTRATVKRVKAQALAGKRAPRKAATGAPAETGEAVAAATPPPPAALVTVPLSSVKIAPENPRHGQGVTDLDAITASIRAHGLLTQPIGYKGAGGRVFITDGQRRLAGAAAAGLAAIEVQLFPKAEAIERGLAAQVEHVALSMMEEADAFAAQLAAGKAPGDVARDFGKSERFVLQRAKLAGLHPPIRAALIKGDLDLAAAATWANAAVDRQASVWKRLASYQRSQPWSIREALRAGKLDAGDRLALFVGEDVYVAAGGVVERDLFAIDRRDEVVNDDLPGRVFWSDRELAERLAQERMGALREKHEADGWAFVHATFDESMPYGEYEKAKPAKTEAARAKLGVWIGIGPKGGAVVEKNLTDAKAAARARQAKLKAKEAKAREKAIEAGELPADTGPVMTGSAHHGVTSAAGRIVGVALASTAAPIGEFAIAAALMRSLWLDVGAGALQVTARPHARPAASSIASDGTVDTAKAIAAGRGWAADNAGALEHAFAGLDQMQRNAMWNVIAASVLQTGEQYPQAGWGTTRRSVAAIGKMALHAAATQPGVHWTPSLELLKGFSVQALAEACRELGIEPLKTKARTAEAVAIAAAEKGWVPPLVRQMTGVAPAPALSDDERAEIEAAREIVAADEAADDADLDGDGA